MKRIIWAMALLIGGLSTSSCGGSKEKEAVDYVAILDKEAPSVEEVEAIVLKARGLYSQLEDIYEAPHVASLKEQFKGYEVSDTTEEFFIRILKNATLYFNDNFEKMDATKINPEVFGIALGVQPCGDAYERVGMALFDENMCNAQVERLKRAGYTLAEENENGQRLVFKKPNSMCYWLVFPSEHQVQCHYDMEEEMNKFENR